LPKGSSVKYFFREGAIQDGVLKDCGRIVIHEDRILVSRNRMDDHNALLRAFASRHHVDRDEVVSNAVRLYFRIEGDAVVVAGLRQVDNEAVRTDPNRYGRMIARVIR
jgi:hypothetical protein